MNRIPFRAGASGRRDHTGIGYRFGVSIWCYLMPLLTAMPLMILRWKASTERMMDSLFY
jgi:hypothetical protein